MAQPKVSAARNSGLQDDHDPSDIGQRAVSKQKSQMEGPAAYALHYEGEKRARALSATSAAKTSRRTRARRSKPVRAAGTARTTRP